MQIKPGKWFRKLVNMLPYSKLSVFKKLVNKKVTSNLILGVLTKDLCLAYYFLTFEVGAITLEKCDNCV
jgi:hypothetical protein